MTDDFHLFGDPHDGNGSVDPDIALVTAYLARELSPIQVLAFEERLATDAEFRSEMQPLIDAWAAPVPSLEHGLAQRSAPLTSLERAESWRRFQSEQLSVASPAPIPLDEPPSPRQTPRRFPMKRIALFAAAVALPMVSFAQVVVYAANHAGLPGHAVARRIVSAFSHESSDPATQSRSSTDPRANQAITDGRVERPLTAHKALAPESAVVTPTPASVAAATTASVPKPPSLPNRALIAELTRRYQPDLVRGDTSADYVVMVLDAASGYLWSTIGDGSVSIEVGGDPRTPLERATFTMDSRDEFWGDSAGRSVGRGGRGMAAGLGIGRGGRGRGGAIPYDSPATAVGRAGGGRGAAYTTRFMFGDTVVSLRYDSLAFEIGGRGFVARGSFGLDSVGRGFGRGRGQAAGNVIVDRPGRGGSRNQSSAPGAYFAGWAGNAGGVIPNHASGLEVPSADRSGVRGLGPLFIESAETYFFAPRELTSSNLRVMVVHLTPSATWRGPF